MKNAIIIHGRPSKTEYLDPKNGSPSNQHWLPWIQKRLLVKGILAQTPEMPEPYLPVYKEWKRVFEQFTVTKETILIGHSCGAGFLVRWLSENKIRVGRVILVAPWLDPAGKLKNDFFSFKIDEGIARRAASIDVVTSDNDHSGILRSVEILEGIHGIMIHEFKGLGHFTSGDMGRDSFPELLELLS